MKLVINAFHSMACIAAQDKDIVVSVTGVEMPEEKWRAFTHDPYAPGDKQDDVCINQLSSEVDRCVAYLGESPDQADDVTETLQLADQLRQLIEMGHAHGCDRIGITN